MKSKQTIQEKLTECFTTLVKIDSPSGYETEVAEHLKKWLATFGFTFKQDEVGNIFANRQGMGEPILFCAHMDTVSPGRGIEVVFKNGFFTSDGKTVLGADNKAPMTAIMVGIEGYLSQTKEPRAIELLFTVKEESGGGVEYFDAKQIRSKHGIIFDMIKPIGNITIASPYIMNFYIEFIGKDAHASTPEKGKNALIPAAQFVSKMKVGYLDNTATIVNIGKFDGGVGINTIPGSAVVSGEIRSFNEKLFQKGLLDIESLAKKSVEGTNVKMKFTTDGYCSGYEYGNDRPWIKMVANICKENGHKVKKLKVRGVSDANPLVAAGIDMLTLGDGVEYAHSTEETISIKSIQQMYELVVAFMNQG